MNEIQSVRRRAEEARAAADKAAAIAEEAMDAALSAMRIAVSTYSREDFLAADAAEKAATEAVRRHARLLNAADELGNELAELEISAYERWAESAWMRAAETPFDLGEW